MSMGPIATRLVSAEEFFSLGIRDSRTELVQGEVVQMSPAGGEHGVVAMRIGARLLHFVEAEALGVVCAAETGFLVSRDPDTVRAPDAAFISRERLGSAPLPKKFWPFAPDLAVEVVSPSDTAESIQERIRDWLAGGARRVWLVYPGTRTVHVHSTPTDVKIFQSGEILADGDLLPGFGCPIAALFD
jgi:Uma2 family endonuclease